MSSPAKVYDDKMSASSNSNGTFSRVTIGNSARLLGTWEG